MAKKKEALNGMIELLDEKRMSLGQIRRTLKIGRSTEWRIINEAFDRRWIEKDSLGKYRLTRLGKINVDTAENPTDSSSLEAKSQIIDFLNLRSDRPTAKCTIEIENADRIKQLDSQTDAQKRFLTHDGLWLSENNTNLKASVAAVADSILDLKAKQMGLFTMLDEEFRQRITPFNFKEYFPGYDALKRYKDLAKTKFNILIEFDGEKWASKQDFEDLDKRIEKEREFFSENIHLMNQRVGLNKAIYNLLSGGDLWTAKLHANHLFSNREELREYLTNHFKINGITDKNQLNVILKNGFNTGFFSEEKMTLSYLKVRKDKELQFLNSLPFLNYMSPNERQQAKTRHTVNQKSSDIINSDNIISTISKELKYFEKALVIRLVKITEKYKMASLSDMLQPTSAPQLPAVTSSLLELFSIFYEILYTYTYRSMIIWPIKIKDKNILNKAHSILFAKIADMRVIISQILDPPSYDGRFDRIFQNYGSIYRTKNLLNHMEVFRKSDEEKESGELISAYWNIHKECVQQAFPEAHLYGWDFDYKDDGWEKFLQLQTTHPNQTFENYIKGNSKS